MILRASGIILTILTLFLLAGCSATSTFVSYPGKISPLKEQLTNPQPPPDLSRLFRSERKSRDQILYNLEHGRLAQLFGQLDLSKKDFARSIAEIQENDRKATISASQLCANLAALSVNDNALPYQADGYERVLLHHYQAINYLLRADLEGAGVEFRWANAEQEESLQRHEKELDQAVAQARQEKVVNLEGNSAYQRAYAQLDELSGKVKNSFQNAYSYYLSGLIYELQGERNDAYIDYKKALEIYPENTYLQRDVLRLAKALGMSDELPELLARFPQQAGAADRAVISSGAELILFYEDGFIPEREEIKLSFFIPSGAVTFSLPYYRRGATLDIPLEARLNGAWLGTTEKLSDIRALGVKSLQEKMPIILTRQAIRAIAKSAAQHEAKEKFGIAGQLGMMAYSIISENADLRSWLTLPENVQMLRVAVPLGTSQLRLDQPGRNGTIVDLAVKSPRERVIVFVARTGNQYHVASVSLEEK